MIEDIYTIDGWVYYIWYDMKFYAKKDNILVTHTMSYEIIKQSQKNEQLKAFIHKQTIESANNLIKQNDTKPTI